MLLCAIYIINLSYYAQFVNKIIKIKEINISPLSITDILVPLKFTIEYNINSKDTPSKKWLIYIDTNKTKRDIINIIFIIIFNIFFILNHTPIQLM